MLLRVSQMVHRKILQADILLGFTEEKRVLVPTKIVVNQGRKAQNWLYKKTLCGFTPREYHWGHDTSLSLVSMKIKFSRKLAFS